MNFRQTDRMAERIKPLAPALLPLLPQACAEVLAEQAQVGVPAFLACQKLGDCQRVGLHTIGKQLTLGVLGPFFADCPVTKPFEIGKLFLRGFR